jgi:GalNAc-alpha-(1->4)-GalNAc-alpha-(1->3)-diNAcBac-PP-undecaprenol alpha-1,4-N-acetyl-D-galactosaminyltransferase
MRIALLISGLGPGGAERVMSLLANGLVARGHEVCLITLTPAADDFHALDPRVQRQGLGLTGDSAGTLTALHANARRVMALRSAIRAHAPQTVLSFVTHMNVLALIACVGLPVRVVISERVDPASHSEGWLWDGLRMLTYRRADAVVVQTDRIAQWFRANAGSIKEIVVIPNPVVPALQRSQVASMPPRPFILGAGRLVRQKGFDLLIRAFSRVAAVVPGLHLAIAGEGPDAEPLRRLAASLGLEVRVHFLGTVGNLHELMRSALAFVLASRYEGFPNVLLEALACGAPSIATDCLDGPREILDNGKYGLLVSCGDVEGLGKAIADLVTSPELRQSLSALGQQAIAPFEQSRILDAWEAVFGAALAK